METDKKLKKLQNLAEKINNNQRQTPYDPLFSWRRAGLNNAGPGPDAGMS